MASDEHQWSMVAAERRDVADLGASLTPEQWQSPSLCEGWRVQDVFAHLVQGTEQDAGAYLLSVIKAGFNVNRATLRSAISLADAEEPQRLVERLRKAADLRKRPPGSTVAGVMAEAIVHGQDMRRALDIDRVPPVEHTVLALWSMVRTGWPLGNKRRIAGLRLVASDADWTYGDGAEVRGTAEALLMATCGRAVAIADLNGPGVATLRTR